MNLKVLQIRHSKNNSPLKAFADVLVSDIEIRDFRIIQHPGDKAYVAVPQTSWRGQGGKIQYKTLITMSDELKWQIESAILAEYQRAKEKTNEGTDSELLSG